MIFKDRIKLSKEYSEWLENENKKNNFNMPFNPETFLAFMEIKGMLKENKKEDHITRQFAIEYIQEECEDCPEYKEGECTSNSHCFEVKRMAINALRTGHWKQISPAKIYECSECGQNVMTNNICCYKFCHGCGAAMEEQNEKRGSD